MAKVYYVHSGLTACYLVRCLLPLQENGWDGDQTSIVPEKNTPENKAAAAQDADIVVFHRPEQTTKLQLARLLKKQGKKIVFDNDDTYKDLKGMKYTEYMDEERVSKGIERINKVIDAFIVEADLVTTSTEFLAEEYRKLNPNVAVLPNCIDPFYYDSEPLRNESDVVRIGVTGSVAVSADLEVLIPLIKHYEKDKRVQLVIFSLPPNGDDQIVRKLYAEEYKVFDSMDIEWQPFVPPYEYPDKLNSLKLDIMIIPRHDSYFNRCKSNVKFLESSMFEIPVIAQGFADGKSPYQDPEDAKHMKIVIDNKDWIPEIDKMILDKEGRRELGRKAKEYVLSRYTIEKNAHLWVEAYDKLKKNDSDN